MLIYQTCGSLKNPPILFLHGFLGCKEDWDEIIKQVKDQFFCISIDLPGHGLSPLNSDGNLFTFFTEQILLVLKELQLDSVHLMGYSMGGRIAMHLATSFPEKILSLYILSAHFGLKSEIEKKARYESDLKWAELLEKEPFELFLKKWYDQPIFQSLVQRKDLFYNLLKKREKQNPVLLKKVLLGLSLSKQPFYLDKLLSLNIPKMFFYGEKDQLYKNIFEKTLSFDNLHQFDNQGHVLPIEAPESIVKILQIKRKTDECFYSI